jgi:hypothetical protein
LGLISFARQKCAGGLETPDWWIPAPGTFGRPTLALAVKPEQIRWLSRPGLRAIISLPVTAAQ